MAEINHSKLLNGRLLINREDHDILSITNETFAIQYDLPGIYKNKYYQNNKFSNN